MASKPNKIKLMELALDAQKTGMEFCLGVVIACVIGFYQVEDGLPRFAMGLGIVLFLFVAGYAANKYKSIYGGLKKELLG